MFGHSFSFLKMLRFLSALLPLLFVGLTMQAQEATDVAKGKADAGKQMEAVKQRLKKLSATEYDLDGIKINAASREVRIPAKVELKKAPIEYMLVHETGKTHESVLTTAISPTAIQLALLLANYQAASQGLLTHMPEAELPPWKEVAPTTAGANRLIIEVEWQAGGKTQTTPLATWVQNVDTRQPPPDLETWVFNGSYVDERGFIGEYEGSIIAVWVDRGALINSPAEGNWRDELWISRPDAIPDEGTPVTVIIRPPNPS